MELTVSLSFKNGTHLRGSEPSPINIRCLSVCLFYQHLMLVHILSCKVHFRNEYYFVSCILL